MERVRTGLALCGLVTALLASTSFTAFGASPHVVLYLETDGTPAASMSQAAPPDVPLPNLDPGRDAEPGLLLGRSEKGASETDPTKYQQWEYFASGETLTLSKFVIWATVRGFAPGKTGWLGIYLLDCSASCQTIDHASARVNGSRWQGVTVNLNAQHQFASGHALVVKVVADSSSDDDLWLAYGTADWDANLTVQAQGTVTTTTAPTTTIATTSTSTTAATATSTTSPLSITTSEPGAPSTPDPSTPTTVSGRQSEGGATTSSTTTTPEDESDFRDQIVVPAAKNGPPPGLGSAASMSGDSSVALVASEIPEQAIAISPQQGLLVAFSTVAQAFTAHLLPFLALAFLGSLLVMIGVSGRDDEDEDTDLGSGGAGRWWFAG